MKKDNRRRRLISERRERSREKEFQVVPNSENQFAPSPQRIIIGIALLALTILSPIPGDEVLVGSTVFGLVGL